MKSNYDGTCKGPEKHTWKMNDEVFYDKQTKAICIDSKCFQTLRDGTGVNGKASTAATRDLETRTKDARDQLELLWPMCLQKAGEYFPQRTETATIAGDSYNIEQRRQQFILASVLFKGLSLRWAD